MPRAIEVSTDEQLRFTEWFKQVMLDRSVKTVGTCCAVQMLLYFPALAILSTQFGYPWTILSGIFGGIFSWKGILLSVVSTLVAAGACTIRLYSMKVHEVQRVIAEPKKVGMIIMSVYVDAVASFLLAFYLLDASESKLMKDTHMSGRGLLFWSLLCMFFVNLWTTFRWAKYRYHFHDHLSHSILTQVVLFKDNFPKFLVAKLIDLASLTFPTYILFGYRLGNLVLSGEPNGFLSNLWAVLFDPGMLLTVSLVIAFITSLHLIQSFIINLIMLRPLELAISPMEAIIGVQNQKPELPSALHQTHPVMLNVSSHIAPCQKRYFSWWDLANLSKASNSKRRKEIFAISNPGGHGWHWQSVLQAVKCELFVVQTSLQTEASQLSVRYDLLRGSATTGGSNGNYHHFDEGPSTSTAAFPGPSTSSRSGPNPVDRNLMLQPTHLRHRFLNGGGDADEGGMKSGGANGASHKNGGGAIKKNGGPLNNKGKQGSASDAGAGKPSYRMRIIGCFRRFVDVSVEQKIFKDTQRLVWVIQSISHLAAASRSEDEYGLVQTNLAEIFSTLINLYSVMDTYSSMKGVNRYRKPMNENDIQMDHHAKLKSSLVNAIHLLNVTFAQNLGHIKLSDRDRAMLNTFLRKEHQ